MLQSFNKKEQKSLTKALRMFIIGNIEGSVKMIFNKKIKTIIAACSASAIFIVNNSAAIAMPYSGASVENVRMKALSEYFSGSAYVIASVDVPEESVLANENSIGSKLVAYNNIKETEEIAYNTVKKLNYSLPAGETVTVREGVVGESVCDIKVKLVGGQEVSREVISETVTKQPIDKIVEYGSSDKAVKPATANGLDYKYVLVCKATAYDMSPAENGGYGGTTATGVPLDKGVIAVDPRVIPLGSRVYIEALDGSWSYGYAVAADTGGAIKGKRVDLCYTTRSECIQFGRRDCRVYVLS